MTLWKVTVVARHRGRSAKSHSAEDALVSYLFTRTKRKAARWAALETIVIESRYDRGGDFYWDDERTIAETEERVKLRRRRKWKGWPAFPAHGEWFSLRTGEVLTKKEARRRNRISLTKRRRRKAREATEAVVPEARELDVFYREFSPYDTRDAFMRIEEPPAYRSEPEDEDVIETLHEEYEELEAGGSPSGA